MRQVCIKRVGATTSLVGSVTTIGTDLADGATSWSVAITADDTNEVLKITVTGEASKNINWVAYGDAVQVSG